MGYDASSSPGFFPPLLPGSSELIDRATRTHYVSITTLRWSHPIVQRSDLGFLFPRMARIGKPELKNAKCPKETWKSEPPTRWMNQWLDGDFPVGTKQRQTETRSHIQPCVLHVVQLYCNLLRGKNQKILVKKIPDVLIDPYFSLNQHPEWCILNITGLRPNKPAESTKKWKRWKFVRMGIERMKKGKRPQVGRPASSRSVDENRPDKTPTAPGAEHKTEYF